MGQRSTPLDKLNQEHLLEDHKTNDKFIQVVAFKRRVSGLCSRLYRSSTAGISVYARLVLTHATQKHIFGCRGSGFIGGARAAMCQHFMTFDRFTSK